MEHYRAMGNYYGYPECCIYEFIQRYEKKEKPSYLQTSVSEYKGFIPCIHHTNEIIAKKVTLEGVLLPTRVAPKRIENVTIS